MNSYVDDFNARNFGENLNETSWYLVSSRVLVNFFHDDNLELMFQTRSILHQIDIYRNNL